MVRIIKTPSGTWKAVIRKRGFPSTIKTFRIKRYAGGWARSTEDDMVRGLYIRKPSSGAARSRGLNEGAEARLLAAVAAHGNPMLKWIEALTIETGMRRSEIISLKLEHVDMECRIARLCWRRLNRDSECQSNFDRGLVASN